MDDPVFPSSSTVNGSHRPEFPKLLKFHLRYHPPGLGLQYLDKEGQYKDKMVDLLSLTPKTDARNLAKLLLNQNLELFHKESLRFKVYESLEKLKKMQEHDHSKRYLQNLMMKPSSLAVTGATMSKKGVLRCATSSLSKFAKVWNALDGSELCTLLGHTEAVTSIQFNFAGNQLLTSSHDGTSRVWNLVKSEGEAPLMSNTSQVLYCRPTKSEAPQTGHQKVIFANYSPSQRLSLSATDRNEVWVHELTYGDFLYKFDFNDGNRVSKNLINTVQLDRVENLLLASPYLKNSAAILDLRKGKVVLNLQGHSNLVNKSSFDFTGQLVATGSDDQTVKVWDIRNAKKPSRNFEESRTPILDIAFDLCGNMIVGGSSCGQVFLWSVNGTVDCEGSISDPDSSSSLIFTSRVQNRPVTKVGFSPNSGLLYAATTTGTVSLYDTYGKRLQTLSEHTEGLLGAEFSHDSNFFMTASTDKSVRIYKLTGIF